LSHGLFSFLSPQKLFQVKFLNPKEGAMIIEVTFQTKEDAADPHSHFNQTEYFECDALPDRATIAKKLSAMTKYFCRGQHFNFRRHGRRCKKNETKRPPRNETLDLMPA